MNNNVVIKVITKKDITIFEKDVEIFYNEYIDSHNIECHYSYIDNTYSVLLIARRK